MEQVSQIIRARRAFFPKQYEDKEISKEIIDELIENANWAPTHKRTEPWRFKIFHSSVSRKKLSDHIFQDFKEHTPPELYSEIKVSDVALRPMQAGCVLALCMQRDPAKSLPEWEEVAALAMAVQNIWLSCSAFNLGAYWATPGFISRLGALLELSEGEVCYGLLYIGYLKDGATAPALRKPIEDKIKWM